HRKHLAARIPARPRRGRYRRRPVASGRQASRYGAPSHETGAPAPAAPIALSLPYANVFVVRIRGIDLARDNGADGDLLGGKRHELVALEQYHRLRPQGAFGLPRA